jgi:hypothetical protein
MNWFVAVGGALWLGGAIQWYVQGNTRMALMAACYAASQFVLMGVK